MEISNSRNIRFRLFLGHQVSLIFLHTCVGVHLFDLRRHTMLWENDISLKIRNTSLLSSLITSLSFHSSSSELCMLIMLFQNDCQQGKGVSILGFELPAFLFELKSVSKATGGNWKLFFKENNNDKMVAYILITFIFLWHIENAKVISTIIAFLMLQKANLSNSNIPIILFYPFQLWEAASLSPWPGGLSAAAHSLQIRKLKIWQYLNCWPIGPWGRNSLKKRGTFSPCLYVTQFNSRFFFCLVNTLTS